MERGRREGKEPIVERGRRVEELDEHKEMESLIKEIDGFELSVKTETSSSSSSSSRNLSLSLSPESRLERVGDLDEEQLFYNSQQLIMDDENNSTPLQQSTLDEQKIEEIPETQPGVPRSHHQAPLVAAYYQHFSEFQSMPSGHPFQLRFNPPPPQWFNPPPQQQFWVYPPPPPQAAGTGFFHPRPRRPAEIRVPQQQWNVYNRGRAATGGRGGNYRAGSRPPLGRSAAGSSNQIGRHSWRPRRGR